MDSQQSVIIAEEHAGDQELKESVGENGEEGDGDILSKVPEEDKVANMDQKIPLELVDDGSKGSLTQESLLMKGESPLGAMLGKHAADRGLIPLASKEAHNVVDHVRSQVKDLIGKLNVGIKEGEIQRDLISNSSLVSDTPKGFSVKKDLKDILNEPKSDVFKETLKLSQEDNISNDDVEDNVREDSRQAKFDRTISKKPESKRSAIYDKEKESPARNIIEACVKPIESDGSGTNLLSTLMPAEANHIAALSNNLDKMDTIIVNTGEAIVAVSGESGSTAEESKSLLEEFGDNGFSKDETVIKELQVPTHLSSPQGVQNALFGRNEAFKETREDHMQILKAHGVDTSPVKISSSKQTFLTDSLIQNGVDTFGVKGSSNYVASNIDPATMPVLQEETILHLDKQQSLTSSKTESGIFGMQFEDKANSPSNNAKGELLDPGSSFEEKIHVQRVNSEEQWKKNSQEASTSKQKIEYVDQKEPSSLDIVALKSFSGNMEHVDLVRVRKHVVTEQFNSSTDEYVEDIVKALKEQSTHDLLCPVCGSCITKRVILRKRKRTSRISLDNWQREEIEDDVPVTTRGMPEASLEVSGEQKTFESGEDEDWGCLACLTFFLRRVRGVRRARAEEIYVSSKTEPGHIGTVSDANISMQDGKANVAKCVPFLFPAFPWSPGEIRSETVKEQTEPLLQNEGEGCLAFIFPTYPWGIETYGEPFSVDTETENQHGSSISIKTEPPSDQTEITGNKSVELPAGSSAVSPYTREIEVERNAKDEKVDSCLSLSFPDYPWGIGETPDNSSEAIIAESIQDNSAAEAKIVARTIGNGERLSEQSSCFSFLQLDFLRESKLPPPDIDNNNKQEEVSFSRPKVKAEKPLDVVVKVEKEPAVIPDRGEQAVQEVDDLDEITEVHDLESNSGVVPKTSHQELLLDDSVSFAQEELSCLSSAFPRFPWGTPLDGGHTFESQMEQENLNLQTSIPSKQTDEASSGRVHVYPTVQKTTGAVTSEHSIKKADHNCLPAVLPYFPWGSKASEPSLESQKIPSTSTHEVEECQMEEAGQLPSNSDEVVVQTDEAYRSCLPLVFPQYPWGCGPISSQEEVVETPPMRTESIATNVEHDYSMKRRDINCIPLLLPSYPWGQISPQGSPEEEGTTSLSQEATPAPVAKEYVSHETRIEAKITSTTSIVFVEPSTSTAQEGKFHALKLDESVTHLDTLIKSDQPFDILAIAKPEEQKVDQRPFTILTTAPSTGYAALDINEDVVGEYSADVHAIQTPQAPEAFKQEGPDQEIHEQATMESDAGAQVCATKGLRQEPETSNLGKTCPCLPLSRPTISWMWPSIGKERSGLEQPLIGEQPALEDEQITAPSAEFVAVITRDSVIEVQEDDFSAPVGSVVETVGLGVSPARPQQDLKKQEYLKSVVYGGLDVTLASLGVVSSAAGGDAKTITVFALSLANLVAGFMALFHNIVYSYHFNRSSFEDNIGQNLWINGSLAVVSFIIFGCVAPLTYGLSFRTTDDRDYKFLATALVSLFCLILLGLGKARVRRQPYIATVLSLITTGFVASSAGYFAGDYIKRWLKKIGFEPAQAPASSPPMPFFLEELREGTMGSLKSYF